MTITFYITGGNVGLKFLNTVERDAFWLKLPGAGQKCAEKIATRTIRFYPAKAKDGFECVLNGSLPPVTTSAPPPTPTQPQTPKDFVTTNPFGDRAANAKPALPGLVPPPPPEMLAVNQPASLAIEAAVQASTDTALEAPKPSPPQESTPRATVSTEAVQPVSPAEAVDLNAEPNEDDEDAEALSKALSDPEPIDKRTRAYREWKARQSK